MLQRIREDEPRVPLSYVRSRLGAPSGWAGMPSAYLAFGGTYGEEVERARAWGWPVEVVAGALHLHQLVDPEGVADTVAAPIEIPRPRPATAPAEEVAATQVMISGVTN